MNRRIVVAGGSLGGLATVEALRKNGHRGSITVLSDENTLPYDRPPLSKQILKGEWDVEKIRLRSPEAIAALDADWRLGVSASRLDLAAKEVIGSDGVPVHFDDLVVATGTRSRTLPDTADLAGVYTLRTLDDSLALRAELRPGKRAVIIGAGFIGAEVACAALEAGMTVSVVERMQLPLEEKLGTLVGEFCSDLQRRHGVDLHCGVGVTSLDGEDGRIRRVVLSDDSVLEADVVIVGIGAVPNTEWLGAELPVDNGLRCDSHCAAAPGVWGVGDVARWMNPLFNREMRIEHLSNAREQATLVAHNVLAAESDRKPYAPIPYFWSDQFGTRLQFFGHSSPNDTVHVVAGDLDHSSSGKPLIALFERDGVLVGAFGANASRQLIRYRGLIAATEPIDTALGLAAV
ncbi:FAD-dependent oxidoreductase [Rhodococcus sp. (in: high G+C Gram-positive bacteria)]|uniref:NAD(P)/FAD-dependent oxidoreductase n=1 Tax=Rhodococcus sp. TaxID=1831 RepID=UPI002579B185|nr:FAD-dependent oxidoreductase [Rhodococcus sp. (in: high G+C Gram-positive bacteria)]MBQ9053054.1 FAD-dependent oxidoreductase [Rhodococcus sp. (in: high G+C Gram-positive bacteria)]